MRAIVLKRHGEAKRAFQIEDRPDLEPGPGEVRLAVKASGLNFADVLARQGMYPAAPPLPSVLGYEAVGLIDAVGPGVHRSRIGERVVGFTRFGGYASQALVSSLAAVPVPDSVDPVAACALAVQACTAWVAAEELVRLHPGDVVLVHSAAGGVGSMLVQLAKRRGCVVVGTAGTPAKLAAMRAYGLDHGICSRDTDFVAAWPEGVARPDVIFDAIGGRTSRRGLAHLAAGGRLVLYGVADLSGDRKNPLRALKVVAGFGLMHPIGLLTTSKSVLGLNMLRIADAHPLRLARAMQAVAGLAGKGELRPLVGGSFAAARIADAHELLAGRASIGKVAVTW